MNHVDALQGDWTAGFKAEHVKRIHTIKADSVQSSSRLKPASSALPKVSRIPPLPRGTLQSQLVHVLLP